MGVAIYRSLDWGLDDSEERELSPQLEQLIEFMVGGQDSSESKHCSSNAAKDEGYSCQDEDEEEEEEGAVHGFHTVLCARRLANPALAPEHYQAVCRALFLETLELRTFLSRIRDAKEMLKKIRTEEPQEDSSTAELDALQHADWTVCLGTRARLWVQLMKELRHSVKLKKVEEQPFNPLPTEFSLTPFEMLMHDIRSRKYKLRKFVVDGNIPTCVKRNAHELILDFIRSRPPLKPVCERSRAVMRRSPERRETSITHADGRRTTTRLSKSDLRPNGPKQSLSVALVVQRSLCSLSRHSVEEEFPLLYAAGCNLRDVCSDCSKFVADVISSSAGAWTSSTTNPNAIKGRPRHIHIPHHNHTLSAPPHTPSAQTLHKLYTKLPAGRQRFSL